MDLPVAVLASRIRLEEKLILAELARRGVPVEVIDTRRALFEVQAPKPRFAGVISREISHTRNVYAARLLEHSGLTVVNSADIVALCGDKLLTTLTLHAAGLPVPRAAVSLSPEHALEHLENFGFPLVSKPVNGSWGHLAARPTDRNSAEIMLEHRSALPSPQHQVVYVQEYIDKPGRDIKAYVMGGEVIGVIYKMSGEWRTNTARGGTTMRCDPDEELTKLLRATADAVGDGILGIDVLESKDGRYLVNEVNHTPEFHGALEVLSVDLVGAYVDFAARKLGIGAAA